MATKGNQHRTKKITTRRIYTLLLPLLLLLFFSYGTKQLYETQTQADTVVDTVINIKQSIKQTRRFWTDDVGRMGVARHSWDRMGMEVGAERGCKLLRLQLGIDEAKREINGGGRCME